MIILIIWEFDIIFIDSLKIFLNLLENIDLLKSKIPSFWSGVEWLVIVNQIFFLLTPSKNKIIKILKTCQE